MKKRLIDIFLIALIGCLPLLWLPGQTLLLGHDAGIPFDPVTHFLDRLTVWTQRFGTGSDQSFALLGATFIHGPEAFLMWLGFPIKIQQLILFVFWFVLPGLTMYYFTYKIWPEKRYLPLIAAVIYMLNSYLLQAWFVAERTKFSIYAVVPLLVYFASAYLLKKMSWRKSIIATGLIFFLFNGGGSFPLYGGLLIIFLIMFLYILFIQRSKEVLKRIVLYVLGVSIVYGLLNAYWILPYINYLLNSFSRDLAAAGGPEGALTWSTYLSAGSSFLNLLRGQGVPDWYLNAHHAYSQMYFTNEVLVLLSFAFPLLALASLVLVKEKKDKFYIYFLILITLVALFFMSGPRSQLGFIFEFMMQNVPGFAIFRSNYYKFGYALWFSYSILIAFTLNILFSTAALWLKKRRVNAYLSMYLLPILFIGLYILYHYPVLSGSFLDYSREPGKELTNRITVPQYVFEYGKWMNEQDTSRRYLVAPELNDSGFIAYTWKYWSSAPVSSLQTKNSFVQNTYLIPQSDRELLKQMYNALLTEDIKTFTDFTEVFAIDGVVVHEDFDWQNQSWGTTDPRRYTKVLDTNKNFKLVKTFGKWKVYDIANRANSLRVTASPKLNFLQGDLLNVMAFPNFDPTSPLFMANLDPGNSAYFAKEASDVYLTPKCNNCDFSDSAPATTLYNPTVLPGSIFYPLVQQREDAIKAQSSTFESQVNFNLTVSDRRITEANWMMSSRQKLTYLQQTFDRYKETIQALRQLTSGRWDMEGKDESALATTIDNRLKEQIRIVNEMFGSNLLNSEQRLSLALAYDEIKEIQNVLKEKQWVTQDINEKKYIVELPEKGTYEVYIKKNSLTNQDRNFVSSVITFTDENRSLSPISEVGEWVYFGNTELSTKQAKIIFTDGTVENILEGINPQYPEGSVGISNVGSILSMRDDSKCVTYTADNLLAGGKQYYVSFEYRNFTDEKELSFYTGSKDEVIPTLRIKESLLPNTRTWNKQSKVLTPMQNSIQLNYCNDFDLLVNNNVTSGQSSPQVVSELRNITIYEIAKPIILLHQERKKIESKNFVINFEKPNAVTYNIKTEQTKEPVTLVMRETYGRAWQFCDAQKKCLPLDDKNHFNSAGLTNGWYFKDGLAGGSVTLFYTAERAYTAGLTITLVSLVFIVGGICWTLLRKKY